MSRLQEALRGKAREAVESILDFPENVDIVIETLRMSFGRNDQIIKSLINKAKMTLPPKEGKPETIITFYNAINNMVSTMQRMNCSGHLNNSCMLEELLQKMSPQMKTYWAMYALENNCENNLVSYVNWLKKLAMAQSLLPTTETVNNEGSKKKSSATIFNAVDEDEDGNEDIKKFKAVTVDERWKFVKQNRCCMLCLRVGHIASNCKVTTKCTHDGCDKRHHKLLHNMKVPNDEAATVNTVTTSQALLKIIPVTLKGEHEEVHTYALLDEGATVTLLDEDVANELKLDGLAITFSVKGINTVAKQARIQNKHENAKSREDKLALNIMENSSTRVNNRWMTGLLWRNKDVVLPGSRSQAERRLRHIEKKMDSDADFSKAYYSKIDDHIAKGYVRFKQ
ncbi:unnamed protein product [Allacma fusca]|uniref:CCHC-type domain-containing protein n=1 Tax=Allacma fusca TaxID=39272 RepID=A0A8J2LYB0_9HEXA|nr:unnamed protein product [Allacma fusca]